VYMSVCVCVLCASEPLRCGKVGGMRVLKHAELGAAEHVDEKHALARVLRQQLGLARWG